MRFLTLAVVALAVMLTACTATPSSDPTARTATLSSDPSGDDLSTSETQFYSFQRLLPLPVSTAPGDTLYRNPMLAIDVLEVLADGRPVAAAPSPVRFVGIDTSAVTVHSGIYIYTIHLDLLLFWKQPNQGLVGYSVPENTEVLVIRYRLVPYDRDPGPRVYTLTARRGD